jgi:hypothetical protein
MSGCGGPSRWLRHAPYAALHSAGPQCIVYDVMHADCCHSVLVRSSVLCLDVLTRCRLWL